MDVKNPIISNIPDGKVTLTWLGRVDINGQDDKEPRIEAIFTRKLNKFESSRVKRWVEVGLFPILKIGSLWESRKYVGDDFYSKIDCTLNFKDNARIICAGHELPGIGYLIPASKYKVGNEWLDSKCLLIKSNDVTVVLPCSEIIRFYYAHSSYIIKSIFSGCFSRNMICNLKESKIDAGTAYIQIRSRIPDIVAPTIGRLIFSDYAMTCAQNIHKSIIKNKVNSGNSWIEAVPPLENKTRIELQGVKLSANAFLGLRILSCSHEFPFRNLIFTRDNDAMWYPLDGVSADETEANSNDTIFKNPRNNSYNRRYSDAFFSSGSNSIHRVTIGRFEDLDNIVIKKFEKNDYIKSRSPNQSYRTVVGPKAENRLSASANEQIDLEPTSLKRSKALPASLQGFFRIIEALNLYPSMSCTYLRLSPVDDDLNLNQFPITRGVRRGLKWSFVDNYTTRRRCIVVEIKYHYSYFYAFEAEQLNGKEYHTMLIAFKEDKSEIGQAQLCEILELCVRNKGRWLKDNQMQDVLRCKIKHTSNSAYVYANRLREIMKSKVIINSQATLPMA